MGRGPLIETSLAIRTTTPEFACDTRLSARESVALLNQCRHRLAYVVQMTEPISLLDFSNVRCQVIVVEYIRNPSGEISSARMFAK